YTFYYQFDSWTHTRRFSCFNDCCDFRDLRSFPTRRSSDLRDVPGVRVFGRPAFRSHGGKRELVVLRDDSLDRRGALQAPAFRHEDRKSTRLNSSHVAISYAVFCWKKKK